MDLLKPRNVRIGFTRGLQFAFLSNREFVATRSIRVSQLEKTRLDILIGALCDPPRFLNQSVAFTDDFIDKLAKAQGICCCC